MLCGLATWLTVGRADGCRVLCGLALVHLWLAPIRPVAGRAIREVADVTPAAAPGSRPRCSRGQSVALK